MSLMYNTKIFTDIYADYATFKADYIASGIPTTIGYDDSVSPSSLQTLYYLLYGQYGNSPISNMDENQFKYKLQSVIFKYGPTWEKKLHIQEKLRDLTDDEVEQGALSIHNHAFNPATTPETDSDEMLSYINEQNTSRVKKSKVGAYMDLWAALSTDVTSQFLDRFSICFKQFVGPERVILYGTEEEE